MKKRRILVVDDEHDLCEILQFNLTAAGYEVDTAHSGEEAFNMDLPRYDLILLDVMMPGMSGFDLAKEMRKKETSASVPIIFLTALGDEDDKLHGFNLGADDYIPKPFSLREVLARVKAVLGRTSGHEPGSSDQLCYQGLVLDMDKMVVTVDGEGASLTRTEFDLLRLMLEHRGKVFSRQEILDRVWPSDVIVTDRTIDVNITRLRKKIGRYSSCIVTRHGYGYLFVGA